MKAPFLPTRSGYSLKNRTSLRLTLSAATSLATLGLLTGCGGGGGSGVFNSTPSTQTILAAQDVAIGSGRARGFVTLKGKVPVSLGFTLTPEALTGLPAGPAPTQYLVSLPPEAAQTTPFTLIGIAYFDTTTQEGLGTVPPHFSPLILINAPQASDPPTFARELAPVAANELAKDHVYVNQFVPGLGASYDDPAQPQRKPNWNTTGQNYFYYDGHMNGYGLGATIPFLQSKATRTDVIKQPDLYPKPGYYAHRHTVSYNAKTKLYTVEITDFQYEDASHSISQQQ